MILNSPKDKGSVKLMRVIEGMPFVEHKIKPLINAEEWVEDELVERGFNNNNGMFGWEGPD